MAEDRDEVPAGAPKGADLRGKSGKEKGLESDAVTEAAIDKQSKAKKNAEALSAALRANLVRRKRERALRNSSANEDSEG